MYKELDFLGIAVRQSLFILTIEPFKKT